MFMRNARSGKSVFSGNVYYIYGYIAKKKRDIQNCYRFTRRLRPFYTCVFHVEKNRTMRIIYIGIYHAQYYRLGGRVYLLHVSV